MEDVPTTLYHVDGFRDELSSGRRLYRSDDVVYESRELRGAVARIYEDNTGWNVKIRFPETDDADAWEIYNALVDRAPADITLDTDQRSFHTALERDAAVGIEDGGTTLRYNRESKLSLDISEDDMRRGKRLVYGEYLTKGVVAPTSVGSVVGGGLGFAIGGPAVAVPGAMAGGSVAGTVGGFITMIAYGEHKFEPYRRKSTVQKKRDKWADRANDWRLRWARRKDIPNPDLIQDINRRHVLRTILPECEDYRPGENRELDRLEERQLDEPFATLMDLHFNAFEDLSGVTLTTTTDTYGEAVDTISTYLDEDPVNVEEPSIYTNTDAFTAMLSHLTYEDEDEQKLTEGGEALIANAMDRDDRPEPVNRFIDDRYAEHLQRITLRR